MAAAITKLVGLDFGTTTSSALVAEGLVRRNAVTGRMELSVTRETFRSPLMFTPLDGDQLDLAAILRLVDGWLARGGIVPGHADVGGGGALLTGLTARRENASGLVAAIRKRLGPALVATADDPCLESWLAFQGSCAPLSRRHPEALFVNLDIGGGTTNLAAGIDGNVLATGCLFVGARHVRFVAGSRRIEALSPNARRRRCAEGPLAPGGGARSRSPGSVMNAISRISPPHPGHCLGHSSPTRAAIFKRCGHRPTRRAWQIRSRGSRIAGPPRRVADPRATELTSQQEPRCASGGS